MALPQVCLVTVWALPELSSGIRASVKSLSPWEEMITFSPMLILLRVRSLGLRSSHHTHFPELIVYAHVLHPPLCFSSKDRRLIHCSSSSTRCAALDGMNVCGCFPNEWNQWTLGLNRLLAPEFLDRRACDGEAWDFFWTILDILVLHVGL